MYAFRNLLGWLTLICIFILVAKKLFYWQLLQFFCILEFNGIFWIDVNLHVSCQITFLMAIVAVFCISEFIGISWIDVNLHISCQMAFLLAFVAVVCISEFIGIFYIDVNLHSNCQKTLILEIIAFLNFRIYMYFFCGHTFHDIVTSRLKEWDPQTWKRVPEHLESLQ